MKAALCRSVLLACAALLVWASTAATAAPDLGEAELLEDPRWTALGLITGFRSVQHKGSGFEARLLEADGSSSVAENPVALYLVVTNNGTADLVQRIWRLRQGVARVRGIAAVTCGIEIRVDVDRISPAGRIRGVTRKTMRLCFISPRGELQKTIQVEEKSR